MENLRGWRRMYPAKVDEFCGDKVSRETAYSMDAWEAPEWRARWRAAPPRQPDAGGA